MVKCFLSNEYGPKHAIKFGNEGKQITYIEQEPKQFLGIVPYTKTTKTKRDIGPPIRNSLNDLGANKIDMLDFGCKLNLLGSRKSVVKALGDAGVSPQLVIGNPPGVFIAVHSNKAVFGKDEVIVRIGSGRDAFYNSFYKNHNDKPWMWWWHDVTHYFRFPGTGAYTIHPQELVLPLENLFKDKKVK